MMLKIFLILLVLQGLVVNASSSSSSSEEEEDDDDNGSSEKESKGHHSKGHGVPWGYKDQTAWTFNFTHCSGKSQSPIDIDTRKAIHDPKLPPITLEGYDLTDDSALTLWNNGHTLELILPSTMRIVTGFDHEFRAAQLHFHWGTPEVPGSEHTIDNVHFPAEIHVVHYNSKYANMSEAASKSDGLVVLGGFIQIGLHENENYEKILAVITDVSSEEANTEIPGFNVRHLLPNNLERFYRYNGSLTTPPCYQTVNWTIFNDTITVSRKQLKALENTLKAGQTEHLNKNFRAPQLLYGRQVLASFQNPPSIIGSGNGRIGGSNTSSGLSEGLSRGDVLAIAFGALFALTLLCFTFYICQQHKKYSSITKDSRQNVIYKPAMKAEA
ncbi:carbonic anhydrase 2 [Esox lucius]|uniref:Carbonic anhydrase n=1 Tax=Esox lucius TaxID=8010 RepID=A0A3P8YKR3_ESOLU|nr:carbonic anhydrase 2 [Esox lucius]